MIRRLTTWLAAVAVPVMLLQAPTAAAVEAGFYVGGNYGSSDSTLAIGPFDELAQAIYANGNFIVTDTSSSFDGKDNAFSFLGGYRFSRHWAIEGAVINLGKFVYNEESIGNFTDDDEGTAPRTYHQKHVIEASGLTVSGLAILPLTYRFEIYARAGITYTKNSLQASVDGTSVGELRVTSASYLGGVGTSFTFADIYAIRLEYQRAFGVGGFDDLRSGWQKFDVDVLTLGFTVTF